MMSNTVNQLAAILLAATLARLISPELFGTYRQIILVLMFLTGITALQLGNGLFYFLPKYAREQHRPLILQAVLLSLASAAIVSVTIYLLAGQISEQFSNPELERLLRTVSLYPFATAILITTPSCMIALDRAIRGSIYSILDTIGRVASVTIPILLGYDLETALRCMVITGGVIALAGFCDMIRVSSRGKALIQLELIKQQLHYAWPLWITSFVAITNQEFGKLLISKFFDPATYAVYSCGAMEIPLFSLLAASLTSAIMPSLVKLNAAGDEIAGLRIWQEASRKCSLIVFPIGILLLTVPSDVMVLLYGEGYTMAKWPFIIYLLVLPHRTVIYAAMLRAIGDTKSIALAAALGLGTNVITSTTLILAGNGGFLSFIAPAIGTVVATYFMGTYQLNRIRSRLGIRMSEILAWKELGLLFALCGIPSICIQFIPDLGRGLALQVGIKTLSFFTIYCLLVWFSGYLKEDERELVTGVLRLRRMKS